MKRTLFTLLCFILALGVKASPARHTVDSITHIIEDNYLSQGELKERVAHVKQLAQINIDSAYREIDFLLKESALLKDSVSELILMDIKCNYHYTKNEVESLLASAELYEKKAVEYNNFSYRIMAGFYIADAYSWNKLTDKALDKLDGLMALMDKHGSITDEDITAKFNLFLSYANVYEKMGDLQAAVRYLHAANEGLVKIDNPRRVHKFQLFNYSNLAIIYLSFDIDSALYYASLSLSLSVDEDDRYGHVIAHNYYVLGQGYQQTGDYNQAIDNYLKAYDMYIKYGAELNITDLYSAIVDTYRALGDSAQAKHYETLLSEYELKALEEKYRSMHKILYMEQENKIEQPSKNYTYLIIVGIIVIVVCCLIILYYRIQLNRKKKSLHAGNYDKLMVLIKENNSDFMVLFDEIYPEFTKKLLSIDPELSRQEVEFCALLRLNLSTKQIAHTRFTGIRAVQTRKSRIRKKLNIPSTVDLYNWFESIN